MFQWRINRKTETRNDIIIRAVTLSGQVKQIIVKKDDAYLID